MMQDPSLNARPYQADILLVTVTEVETLAVLEVFLEQGRYFIDDQTFYDLGEIGGAKVSLVRSEMGAHGQRGATLTIQKGIKNVSPIAVIMVGIAFGIDPTKQKIGDILVSRKILDYDPERIGSGPNGELKATPRGDRTVASSILLDRFESGALDWKEADKAASVDFGLILSGQKLIDNEDFREKLLKVAPEAIGGEMEGAGLSAAAAREKVEWILVKAICDWGDGKKSLNKQAFQKEAASNAARFVFYVIGQGGLTIERKIPLSAFRPGESVLTEQRARELAGEKIQRFKELQGDIMKLKNLREFPAYLGTLGFTAEQLEKRYQQLYQETLHILQRLPVDQKSYTHTTFEEMVYRETSMQMNQAYQNDPKKMFVRNWGRIVGSVLFSPLVRVERVLAQTSACIATLELFK